MIRATCSRASGCRRATEAADVGNTPGGGDATIVAGKNAKSVVVGWAASVCDKKVELTVQGTFVIVAPAPRPDCDAMAVDRSVTLKFAHKVDADRHDRDLRSADAAVGASADDRRLSPRTTSRSSSLTLRPAGTRLNPDEIARNYPAAAPRRRRSRGRRIDRQHDPTRTDP